MVDRYRDRPFPADDDYSRDDSYSAPQPQGGSDPLAELARLIGQADPFSNFNREQAPQQTHAQPPRGLDTYYSEDEVPAEDEPPATRPSWLQNIEARQTLQQAPRPEPAFEQPRAYEPPRMGEGRRDTSFSNFPPRFDPQPSFSEPYAQEPEPSAPLPSDNRYGTDRYDDVLYGRPSQDYSTETAFSDQAAEYDAGLYDRPPYDEYEQEPPKRRGTMTIAAVLVLAIVGTGAAFAYRTFVASPRSGEPPVIKADTTPSKITPPGATADAAGKQIYDRVTEKTTERMVSREEQPVDINARSGPRVVFPPLTANDNPPTVASASPVARPTGPGVGNGTLANGEEPRKIRTLSIRPDQADASAAMPPAAPAVRQSQTTSPSRAAVPPPASTGSTSVNAPVSLSPQTQPAADHSRVAALAPSGSGAYVQVSSQKSEADAQTSFRALQGKYSSLLGSQTAVIRKADLGSKGVFYRAMVGPFSSDEAVRFCQNLKSAGGQCIVQRN